MSLTILGAQRCYCWRMERNLILAFGAGFGGFAAYSVLILFVALVNVPFQ